MSPPSSSAVVEGFFFSSFFFFLFFYENGSRLPNPSHGFQLQRQKEGENKTKQPGKGTEGIRRWETV